MAQPTRIETADQLVRPARGAAPPGAGQGAARRCTTSTATGWRLTVLPRRDVGRAGPLRRLPQGRPGGLRRGCSTTRPSPSPNVAATSAPTATRTSLPTRTSACCSSSRGAATRCGSTVVPTWSRTPRGSTSMVVKGHRPVLALVVEIDEVFGHCAKAFMRSQLWHPSTWDPLAVGSRPEIAKALERPEDTDRGAREVLRRAVLDRVVLTPARRGSATGGLEGRADQRELHRQPGEGAREGGLRPRRCPCAARACRSWRSSGRSPAGSRGGGRRWPGRHTGGCAGGAALRRRRARRRRRRR